VWRTTKTFAATTPARGTTSWIEEILRIAFDDSGDLIIGGDRVMSGHHVVQRARLKVDTVEWIMAKLAPKKYGDRPIDDEPQAFTISWQSTPSVSPPPRATKSRSNTASRNCRPI